MRQIKALKVKEPQRFVFVKVVFGHGSLVNPLSRNAVDRDLPWSERAPAQPCICANTTSGSATGPGTPGCDNAQACYWYQQGK